jgi:indole-3-glycerol phosphate synthase
MPASLDSIIAATRQRVSRRKAELAPANGGNSGIGQMEREAEAHRPRGFRRRLQQVASDGIAIIAELKKASPSRGLIRSDFKPSELARQLEQAGAAALSVLTDEEFFRGSLENLREASSNTALPCLRKDFIVDEVQILEARANHADAILLIVAALEQTELVALATSARSHQLDALCEVHDEEELRRALDAGCDLIGVNSRDLHTFNVDLATPFRLIEKIPNSCLSVAESGIRSSADLARLEATGYQAFLIGESLMKEKHPGKTLQQLLQHSKLDREGSKLAARGSKLSL